MSKRRIKLTEGDLRRIVNESVKRLLKESENYWSTVDINPRAIEGFRKDCRARNMEQYKQDIEEYCEIIKNAALSGDSYKVKMYSKYLITTANLINDYKLEDLRKAWEEQDNA